MSNRRAFRPSVEGALESRLALSGLHAVAPTGRTVVSARAVSYQPMKGAGINLSITGINTSLVGNNSRPSGVTIHSTTAHPTTGDFKVRLYWSSTPKITSQSRVAGEKIFHFPKPIINGLHGCSFSATEASTRPANTRYLIAVIDPNHDIPETTRSDNGGVYDFQTRKFSLLS